MNKGSGQREMARLLLEQGGIVRLSEFKASGITAATIGRMVKDGEVLRLARGLYQLPDALLDVHHSLAEAAKKLPKGVVCLVSALAYHNLTDQLPRAVWMAIGTKDWEPKTDTPPIRTVRFTEALLSDDILTEYIEGVPVKVFGVAKTIADCFRHAERGGVATVIRLYLEALTANG